MSLSYLSVCSGIEAATVAWHPLGWTPVAFSEIDRFPAAVLAHHYPLVPNWGDMTQFQTWPDAAIDLLVGGTPCQSFSVAGLRAGLDDPRGGLMLTYLALARRYRPRWVVWENVPGVLSSGDGRDFGALLGGLAELGYGFAYRVLDAQFFGVPQRRRRVFVVGCLGDWRSAAAVLLERHSLSGYPAPRREAGQGVAPTISSGAPFSCTGNERSELDAYVLPDVAPTVPARRTGGGGLGTDFDCDGGLIASTGQISHCLNASGMGRLDYESETLIAHALRAEGFDVGEDGTGRGTPLVPCAFDARQSDALTYGNLTGPLDTDGHSIGVAVSSGRGWWSDSDTGATIRAQDSVTKADTLAYTGMAVRRLTPRECERLQGFPDDYTLIPYRGKPAADGPRYKALGNSMAVPVMRWIAQRIQQVEALHGRAA